MNNEYKNTDCRHYLIFGGNPFCHCVDYSTGLWYRLSSGWDDFRIDALPNFDLYQGILNSVAQGVNYFYWPDALAENIQKINKEQGTDFLDNGKRWN